MKLMYITAALLAVIPLAAVGGQWSSVLRADTRLAGSDFVRPLQASPGNALVSTTSNRPTANLSKGVFLVASQGLQDPNFSETVVLLLHYDSKGAVGVVINRPTDQAVSRAFPDIKELEKCVDTIYVGGPVAADLVLLLVRSHGQSAKSLLVFEDVHVASSPTVLAKIAREKGRGTRFRVYAGYAGWGPGQLESEVSGGSWYISRADPDMVFNTPAPDVWPEALRRNSGEWTRIDRPLAFGVGDGQTLAAVPARLSPLTTRLTVRR